MFDWNDVRLFLTVARSGSTRAAAQDLGLNQTTVARRMEVLERCLGLRLFDRTTRGHRLTEQGQALCEAAQPMREAAEALSRRAEVLGRSLQGTIRVSAAEVVFSHLVAPIVAEFRREHPEVRIEYDSSEGFVDLAAGEADLAFRAMVAPDDERLVARKLADVAWAVYCSRAYAATHGMPESIEAVRAHAVVAFTGPVGERPGDLWFMSHADPAQVAGRSNTVSNLTGVLRAGIGVGCLPCFHADAEPMLLRCFPPPPEMTTAIWLLTTPERRKVPRIEAFVRLAALRFRDLRPRLRGEGTPAGES
ncbi:transcriptional regulator, LysR family [Rubellimicrobium mesophilum DSM 19309]|uniref:Transcriptional regulator, LysR family n=1 Tax=Rubellimicrobium mesophilum DSM 19309 TaxID=442562 RepID=A0A017HS57_9RHOB|nr:LysR family transcriptional regulator [Rubellimicrobium mesophilum]EYD77160.1 transcriptional regulator, LysR family [Rubellimicrobium mesophilum DSM 19309]